MGLCASPTSAMFISFAFLLLSTGFARAGPTNVTIDDAFQGEGAVIQYFPASVWSKGSACATCPSPAQAYDGTWQDITYDGPANGTEVPYSMSIIFNGTAIYAYTIIVPNYVQSYLNITVDGQPAGQFDGSKLNNGQFQYNVPMCSITGLDEGQHILQLSAGGPQASLLLFDYAIYTIDETSSSGPSESVTYKETTIDDTYSGPDAVIQYNPSLEWTHGTACQSGCANPQQAYNGTWQDITFDPTVPGRNLPVSMTIIFTGTGITPYTISVPNYAPSILNITLDGLPAGQYDKQSGTNFEYSVPMASFSNLTNDRHILTLTAGPTSQNSGNLLLFDYAVITTANTTASDGSTPTSNSGSSSPSQTASSGSGSSSGSNASTATVKESSPVGAIAGGVVGGALALALLTIFFFLRRRRRQQSEHVRASNVDSYEPKRETVTSTSAYTSDPFAFPASYGITPYGYGGESSANTVTVAALPQSPTSSSDTSGQRQAVLSRRMEEKMRAMSDVQRRASASIAASHAPASSVSGESVSPTLSSAATSSAWQQQIETLQAEVAQLQGLMRSGWAQGLTDEAPPEYHRASLDAVV